MRIMLATRDCKALKRALEQDPEITVVGSAADAHAVLAQVKLTDPDVVLLDLDAPGLRGSDLLSMLQSVPRPPKVVAFSERREVVRNSLAERVFALVSKEEPFQYLLSTLYTASGLSPYLVG
jgi:DNA-binding NarL/FixJ family response regulator